MNHSPLPWIIERSNHERFLVMTATSDLLCRVHGRANAADDAAFIVKSANSHGEDQQIIRELVVTCETILQRLMYKGAPKEQFAEIYSLLSRASIPRR